MAGNFEDPKRPNPFHKIDLETLSIALALGVIAIVGLMSGYEHIGTAAISAIAGIAYGKAKSD